jgi:hypothetical protein
MLTRPKPAVANLAEGKLNLLEGVGHGAPLRLRATAAR